MEVDTAFAAQGRTNLVGAFLKYAAPDATSLPMGGTPIHGREAIAESMLSLAKGELLWTPVGADIANGGDLGYTWGTFSFHSKDAEGKPAVSHGKYTTVWKKQPDASWKFVMDIGNTSPPPQ